MRKKNTVVIKQRDEWSGLAQFLGDMIAKYAEDMDFKSLPDPDKYGTMNNGRRAMIISERIFKIIKEKNITQAEFAKRVGIATSTVSEWKKKKTNPSADKIRLIVLDYSDYGRTHTKSQRREMERRFCSIWL